MTAKKIQETSQAVEQPANNDCFIIMPIADHPDYKQGHFKRVYEDILAPACRAAGYKPVRADDTKQANLIQLDILQKLLESPMAICDLSTRNPNVLFELGLRQAFDKPTILVQEEGTPKIFDINIFRYIEYRNGLDYRDVLADQHAIEEVLKETRKAVEEGKSVNSIIKLLSITNPATLQDTSNFGDKEYFQVLMSEINSIKNLVNRSAWEISKDYNYSKQDSLLPIADFVKLYVDESVPQHKISSFYDALEKLSSVSDLTAQPEKRYIVFSINGAMTKTQIEKLANDFGVKFKDIIIDSLPF